jgi:HK97 family phage prohead protease
VDLPAKETALTTEGVRADMVKCAACGSMNEPDATKCADCGAPMKQMATAQNGLFHREDGLLEVRMAMGDWEIRHSGRADESFTVRGYAAVFNQLSLDLGGFREQLAPTAFDEVLRSEPDVHFVWDHDTRYVGARTTNGTLELRTDSTGLYMDARVGPYSWAKDLRTALERRDINQGSFAFHVSDEGDDWEVQDDESILRTVRSVDGLYDVTVTAKGAYPQTSMAAAQRSLEAAVADGRLPSAGAALVAAEEQGEQSSQEGDTEEERADVRALRNRIAVERDRVSALLERVDKL